jgi:hypothetical protein
MTLWNRSECRSEGEEKEGPGCRTMGGISCGLCDDSYGRRNHSADDSSSHLLGH